MNVIRSMVLFLGYLLSGAVLAGMSPMGERELGSVTGQEGAALDLDLYINAELNANGNPQPLVSLSSCAGGTPTQPNPCFLGLSFNNRTGEWITIKDFYATLRMFDVFIDAANINPAATTYQNPGMDRFEADNSGTGRCLVDGSLGGCGLDVLDNRPALKLSFRPHASPLITAASYRDISWFMNIGRVSAEYDCAACGAGGIQRFGYQLDQATGSVLGLRIARVPAAAAPAELRAAAIRVDGNMLFFGF